ncbi:hypothetical protein EGN72_00450 [Pseudorhodobacter sp. E13]|uniref:hypothetical protein n=1 Tax=Pseudorhodobacter sp. E13 TaxID=2487931 RepID=UPI000FC09532|nr:hypothetical protein [Pseudorhodobacter sp. E13]RUS65283.1 hypothetical protein EGN72_00450 [Pseudorhodobacter sp. E13]
MLRYHFQDRPIVSWFRVSQVVATVHHLRRDESDATALRILNGFAIDLMAIPSVEDLFWYVAQKVV